MSNNIYYTLFAWLFLSLFIGSDTSCHCLERLSKNEAISPLSTVSAPGCVGLAPDSDKIERIVKFCYIN